MDGKNRFPGARIHFAASPALRGVWSRFAAGSSAGVVPAVRRVVMYGLYSARRGEGEFLARQPGKMSYLQLNQRKK